MKRYYSPSTRGFYLEEVHVPSQIPADAVPVTEAQRQKLIAGQAEGGEIEPEPETGKPRLVRAKIDQRAELLRAVKREAARRIEATSPPWRQLNDLRLLATPAHTSEQAKDHSAASSRFAAIDAVRAASDAIEAEVTLTPAGKLSRFAVREHPLWPEQGHA